MLPLSDSCRVRLANGFEIIVTVLNPPGPILHPSWNACVPYNLPYRLYVRQDKSCIELEASHEVKHLKMSI